MRGIIFSLEPAFALIFLLMLVLYLTLFDLNISYSPELYMTKFQKTDCFLALDSIYYHDPDVLSSNYTYFSSNPYAPSNIERCVSLLKNN